MSPHLLVAAVPGGAAAMYLLDADRGRGRRALLCDQVVRAEPKVSGRAPHDTARRCATGATAERR